MSFRPPAFNLTCNVWHDYTHVAPAYAAPDATFACNLSPGRRVIVSAGGNVTQLNPRFAMELLLPKRSDIRAAWNAIATEDLVEVPAGTNRWYAVSAVDDVGRGFTNEYRLALIYVVPGPITFTDVGAVPYPVPLP